MTTTTAQLVIGAWADGSPASLPSTLEAPMPRQYRRTSPSERFWPRVNKDGPVPPHAPELGPCWIWTGSRRNGYGEVWDATRQSKFIYAHRLSYEMHFGSIPDDMDICHKCDNPPCVRADHLFLGTHLANVGDMRAKGRGFNPPIVTGSAHYAATLTDEQVAEIRRRWAVNPSGQRALAREYGVSQSTIWRLIHGVTRG